MSPDGGLTAIGQETAAPLELVAAALRGDAAPWPADGGEAFARTLLLTAAEHGVDTRLADGRADAAGWPPVICEYLRRAALDAAVVEVLRQQEVRAVLDSLSHAGVRPLVLKGTALAYSLYPTPHERPRIDTDLLLPIDVVDRAWAALAARGYVRAAQNTGRLVSHQFACARTDERGVWHAFDIHWKLANPQVFANLITYDELAGRAEPIEPLGPHARVPCLADMLVIACLHQAAHHPEQLRLIWTLDLDLLTRRLGADGFGAAVAIARERGLATVCAYGLRTAQRWFDTPVPADVLDALDAVDPRTEPAARYLGHVTRLDNLWEDLQQLPRWGDRARLVSEHAFPSAEYMLRAYGTSRRVWLPALYVHRLVRGGWRWVRQR